MAQAVPLLALAVCAGGLLGFASVVEELEGGGHRFDEAVLLALRQPGAPDQPIGPAWLALTMRDLTALGGIPVLGAVRADRARATLMLARRWRAVLLLLVSLPGGLLLNIPAEAGLRPAAAGPGRASGRGADRELPERPRDAFGGRLPDPGRAAGRRHPERRQQGYILVVAVLLTLLVGGSRVYLGVHWPTDVLAGWCLGAAWAMGCWLLLKFAPPLARPGAGAASPPHGKG